MIEKTIEVNNPTGLHARPASKLCSLAAGFKSDIEIDIEGKTLDAKSILNIMGACIRGGMELTVRCCGCDEEEAVEKICEFLSEFREQV